MLATRQPTHQTVKLLTLYKRFPLKNKGFQALFMLKPLFIKRKQLNFQKHIDRAKTNPARQSPRAGLIHCHKAHGLGRLRVDQHRPGGFAREQGQGAQLI